MNKLQKEITLFTNVFHNPKFRIFVAVLTLALFVLAAGAPSATIGIGK